MLSWHYLSTCSLQHKQPLYHFTHRWPTKLKYLVLLKFAYISSNFVFLYISIFHFYRELHLPLLRYFSCLSSNFIFFSFSTFHIYRETSSYLHSVHKLTITYCEPNEPLKTMICTCELGYISTTSLDICHQASTNNSVVWTFLIS